MKVWVTGIGVVSAAGQNVAENLCSLQENSTGIQWSDIYERYVGAVPSDNETLCARTGLHESDPSRTTLLALHAARECWGTNRHLERVRTGLLSATSAGGLDRMGRTTESLAVTLGFRGLIGTLSTACSSGANAIMHGARLLEAGMLDRVLVGGSDPLTVFNSKGFGALNIYSSELCKPFDAFRSGLNLGEGAGFLLLENQHSLEKTGNTPLCTLAGWCNKTDAYHQTASSPTGIGAALAMRGALEKAGLAPEDVQYVNAHGTGTGNNDLSESMAFLDVFGQNMPPFSSTKSITGHTLAAAGAVEAVYSVLALLHDAVLPNLHFETAMPETGLQPVKTYRTGAGVHAVLSNSFGFGGNCTSLVFTRNS